MENYNILYTTDGNYFAHMLTSIYSLLENNKGYPITLHVVETNFTSLQRKLLESFIEDYENVDLKVYEWNPNLEKHILPKWRGTDIANARLFSKEIIPDVKKLLYLDSDTIVDNSLTDLFNKEITNPIGAVLDFNIPLHLKGLVNKYFNSGVLLLDYELWEKEDYTKILYDTFENNTVPLVFPDQDLLNLALSEKIDVLDMSYNIVPLIYDLLKYPHLTKRYSKKRNYYSYEEIVETAKNPHIYHMLTYFSVRPWFVNNHHPFNSLYENYRMGWDSSFESVRKSGSDLKVNMMAFTNMVFYSYLPDSVNYEIKKIARKLYRKK